MVAGGTRRFEIALNKDSSFYCFGITQNLNEGLASRVDPTAFVGGSQEGIFFNVWDSRDLARWFLPNDQPLSTAAGGSGSRNAYGPAPFYVPAGNNLIVELFNRNPVTIIPFSSDFQMTFHGVLANIDGSTRF